MTQANSVTASQLPWCGVAVMVLGRSERTVFIVGHDRGTTSSRPEVLCVQVDTAGTYTADLVTVPIEGIGSARAHAGVTADVHTADTTWRIHLDDQLLVEAPRTSDRPVARFKVRKPEPPRRLTSTDPPG